MESAFKLPFYAKSTFIFISLFATVFILKIGEDIILPLVFATILAIVLNPLVNFLTKKKFGKIISISVAVFLALGLLVIIVYIVSSQIGMFRDAYPQLKSKFNTASSELVHWFSVTFNIRVSKINAWTKETQNEAIADIEIGEKLGELGKMMFIGMLVPVYLFMILYYKSLLLEFVRRLFHTEHRIAVEEVLANIKNIIQTYLIGLFFEMLIIATLNSVSLLLLGIDYAIMLGITGAVLNIIPYIGGMLAIALPMIIAFVTKDSFSSTALVFCVYVFIQFVDNHYIIPKIVASRVKINALVSVIVVLIGGVLWGVPGMFLSIPLTAILKVIFDHIEPLKPWGFLLGNIIPGDLSKVRDSQQTADVKNVTYKI